MHLQFQSTSFSSAPAASGGAVSTSPPPTRKNLLPIDPLSVVASFATRDALSFMALTCRSWRLATKKNINFELVKELNLFYEALKQFVEEHLRVSVPPALAVTKGLPLFETFETNPTFSKEIEALKNLNILISAAARTEAPLSSTPPLVIQHYTQANLHLFACNEPQVFLTQQFVGGCLDILTGLDTSTLQALRQIYTSPLPSTKQRTDYLGRRLICGFPEERGSPELLYTPLVRGLIDLALQMKETAEGTFEPAMSDAEWLQAELYRLARLIQEGIPINLEEWKTFYRELFSKAFLPIHLPCTDSQFQGIPSGWSFESPYMKLDPALTPFLAVIPPILRDNSLHLPCYTYPAVNNQEADQDPLRDFFPSLEMQQHLWIRFTLSLKLLQQLVMLPRDRYQATATLVRDLLKYSRDLRKPRKGRRHYSPYQFSEPLNYLEELVVQALNLLPNKQDRLSILCLLPHRLGNPWRAAEGPLPLLDALAQRVGLAEDDVRALHETFTRLKLFVQPPPEDASDPDRSSL